MRKVGRITFAIFGLLLTVRPAAAAPADPPPGSVHAPVRFTIEVSWSVPAPAAPDQAPAGPRAAVPGVELEVSEGRVVEALAWPSGPEPEPQGERVWRLGMERTGRVRARVEAPVGASLVLRAAGQA